MRTSISICLFFVFLVTGCKESGAPTSPIHSPTPDELLRQALIGTWRASEYSQISFQADGSFADSATYIVQFGSNPVDTMTFVKSGTYTIENSFIEYPNVHFGYHTTSGKPWPGLCAGSISQRLNISGNSLRMIPGDVLTRVTPSSSTTDLVGSWRSLTWEFGFSQDTLNPVYVSRLEMIYVFGSDFSTYSETWNFLDPPIPPTTTHHGSYNYVPPHLRVSIESDTTLTTVSFANSKMYRHNDRWAQTFVRVR